MLDIPAYNPAAWHWRLVGETRCWSSALGRWVSQAPAGAPVTSLNSLAELDEVLRRNGLPSPLVTAADVDAERDRRIAGGFAFAGVRYQSRPDDRENIAGASTAALGAMMAGAQAGDYRWHGGDSDFAWIAEDNSTVPMDAQTMFVLGQAAMAHKQAMIFAARTLKDMEPIPADYAGDQHWP